MAQRNCISNDTYWRNAKSGPNCHFPNLITFQSLLDWVICHFHGANIQLQKRLLSMRPFQSVTGDNVLPLSENVITIMFCRLGNNSHQSQLWTHEEFRLFGCTTVSYEVFDDSNSWTGQYAKERTAIWFRMSIWCRLAFLSWSLSRRGFETWFWLMAKGQSQKKQELS